jgi:type I restriction enzyme, S subunit
MGSRESEFKTLTQVGTIGRGKSKHRPRNDPDLYGGEYPFVQTGDVKHAPFYLTEYTQTYNERGLAQSKLWPRGTLCITIAANIADTAILAIPACFPDSILGFAPKRGMSDVRYVKYCMDGFRAHIELISRGTTQDNLSLDKLLKLKFWFPDIDVQRNIAAILSAYDELIANNQQRIALLEGMAEEIYREWFVRMRFPGYTEEAFVKGVPQSWSRERLGNHCHVVKGKSYAADELTDEDTAMPFVTLKSFNRGGGYRANGLKYYTGEFKAEQVVNQGDIVMAVTDMTQDRVVVGQAARVPDLGERGAVISLDVVKVVPALATPLFLYCFLRYSGFSNYIKEFANGANVLHLKPDLIGRQVVVMPPNSLQEQFAKLIEPIVCETETLVESSEKLTAVRAAVLPRLISGKLKVDHIDIRLPPSMRVGAEAEAAT